MKRDEASTIVIDAGMCEWRCGWAYDEGPSEVLSGTPDGSTPARLAAAFIALEATPAETSVIISERPGTLAAEREGIAAALFSEHGVHSVCIAAAPLLALFHIQRDTCLLVDVGERSCTIFPVYEGHAVLDAATAHPLAGGNLPSRLAGCDGLFEPSRLGLTVVGVHQAVLRTIALVDVSLRGTLLHNIVLIGGGSLLDGFPERLRRELAVALKAARLSWVPRVVANPDRRYACWLGGALFQQIPSSQQVFLEVSCRYSNPGLLSAPESRCLPSTERDAHVTACRLRAQPRQPAFTKHPARGSANRCA